MSSPSDAYLTLLQQVENALEEALHGGKVPPGHSQRDELESMRREVSAVRRAMLERDIPQEQPMTAAMGMR
ncbi:hypothetical protein JCM17844_23390 [Iodidimonas gelatinilytica]|uniref:Uncharacterized protein n=2 Tax=Iodidimonas TaxID=2066486 RepID=A0A5A7MYD2_9PROT|nr:MULTISPECIES: hypothetical protein [Iodidimonas]GEQ98702.1 hypothetical protein JCM17844_23390 [Iodidimonas gelatinilytica]GER00848.1 hypothetical protein JCM17845_14710 [Iodidimonas gelatinilytica]GGO07025.1 hypothetical protein GCM10007972_05910 [Iodidimonas muriae]